MVLLIVLAIAAVAVPFFAVVVLANGLLAICEPKTRVAAVACFLVPVVAVLAGLISWGSSSPVWRYSAQGPIIWFLVWPALALACGGIIGAGFTVAAFRRRQLRSMHDAVATPTI
jgi:hypothetical protein